MKFCIDDANVEKIRRIYEYYPVDGVSTNPSILAKSGRDPYEVLREIRSIIGEDGELFVQATSTTAEGMVEEAHRIVEVLGKTTLIKIPCVPEGFKAMKQLKKEGIRFNLVMAGKGPHEEEIKAKIRELGFEENAHIVGHILREDLLTGLYMLADLFVFPSLYDNGPMVVREAANAGTPSIVVRGSSAAEGIDDMVNGFYCEDDADSIAEVIKKAFEDPERTASIGIQAKETIPVAWDDLIDDVLDRYQYLIERYKR